MIQIIRYAVALEYVPELIQIITLLGSAFYRKHYSAVNYSVSSTDILPRMTEFMEVYQSVDNEDILCSIYDTMDTSNDKKKLQCTLLLKSKEIYKVSQTDLITLFLI